jgi:hypothetical protein
VRRKESVVVRPVATFGTSGSLFLRILHPFTLSRPDKENLQFPGRVRVPKLTVGCDLRSSAVSTQFEICDGH